MLSKLSKLESILGYNFKQQNDVQVAIVHPGFHKNAHNRATAFGLVRTYLKVAFYFATM